MGGQGVEAVGLELGVRVAAEKRLAPQPGLGGRGGEHDGYGLLGIEPCEDRARDRSQAAR